MPCPQCPYLMESMESSWTAPFHTPAFSLHFLNPAPRQGRLQAGMLSACLLSKVKMINFHLQKSVLSLHPFMCLQAESSHFLFSLQLHCNNVMVRKWMGEGSLGWQFTITKWLSSGNKFVCLEEDIQQYYY